MSHNDEDIIGSGRIKAPVERKAAANNSTIHIYIRKNRPGLRPVQIIEESHALSRSDRWAEITAYTPPERQPFGKQGRTVCCWL